MKIKIGTRGSKLALAQTNWVKGIIERELGWEVEVVVIKTRGDKITDVPLARIGGKGLFVKEIEEALLEGSVDIAVHSLKDMPAVLPEGLEIIAFPQREEPWDVLISRDGLKLSELDAGTRVGTSSLRRSAQLKRIKPQVEILTLRGNLDTRLRKLKEGLYDAIIVALAGLNRLSIKVESAYVLHEFIPAVGQGLLAVEARNGEFAELTEILDDERSRIEATAERAFLATIGGSCQVPLGALARCEGGRLSLRGFVAHPSGFPFYEGRVEGKPEDAAHLGTELAKRLLREGAVRIVEELGLG